MKEYDFTLKFSLQSSQAVPESYAELLYERGCDDALSGIGKSGSISLHFIREAPSAYEAVCSAIADVKTVVPDATLVA
jgi:hypothetical protein